MCVYARVCVHMCTHRWAQREGCGERKYQREEGEQTLGGAREEGRGERRKWERKGEQRSEETQRDKACNEK